MKTLLLIGVIAASGTIGGYWHSLGLTLLLLTLGVCLLERLDKTNLD